MKSRRQFIKEQAQWHSMSLLGLCAVVSAASAAEPSAPPATTNAPTETASAPLTPEQMFEGGTNTFNNWVEVSAGGFLTSGNKAQLQQRHQLPNGAFGGIEDFHYSDSLTNGTTVTIDGRALFDNHDYKLNLDARREKLGYLRFSYNEFRTWFNGDGGFWPPSGTYFPLSGDALGLDRGEISFEAGLTLDKWPKVAFKYTHTFRDGDQDSTSWGFTHPPGSALARGLSPSFYDIDEHSDIFQLDATHHFKATDFGAGLRYETGKLNDARLIDQFPGEAFEQKITDRQGTTYDLFNVHAFTETWIKKNLLFSTGYSYCDLDNNFSGSRIYGTDFDVGFVPNAAQTDFGYFGLNGGSRLHEYVMDLNLMAKPWPNFTIAPSVRVMKEDTDADSSAMETLGLNSPAPFSSRSDQSRLDVRERLDLRYTGVTNWVFWARPELTEGDGNLTENGGLVPLGGIGIAPITRETDDTRFFQKYSAGARWYPTRRVSLDFGGYYKNNNYDYTHLVDSTPNTSTSGNRYPAYLVMQNFATYDGNVGLTLRPLANLTLMSRYEYQFSTIHTKPDPVSLLDEVESSTMTSHILAQDITWSPWSRLYLQADFNYVLSDTKTPTSDFTQAVLNSQNNYWTLNFTTGLVLDNRTDLKFSYFYYQADNYQNNAPFGVPLGAGDEEHGVTATLTRHINKNLRLTLRYGFFRYDDVTYGGNRDYDAHMVYSSLQYRF